MLTEQCNRYKHVPTLREICLLVVKDRIIGNKSERNAMPKKLVQLGRFIKNFYSINRKLR